jgi:PrgI family protein
MRFQVPQFIEVEDKIFGPLTLKQFIFLAGGGGLSFLIYSFLNNLVFSIIPIIAVMVISALLAFYRVNNRPFINVIESAFHYFFGNKLFIWKKVDKPRPTDTATALKDATGYASVMVPKIANSRLKDLAWSLDIKESIYSNDKQK